MTFTTSSRDLLGLCLFVCLVLMAACSVPHVDGNALAAQQAMAKAVADGPPSLPSDPNARITVPARQALPSVLPPVEHNPDPPAPPTPPAKQSTKERPKYGETWFLGTITSVYYYPQGGGDSDGSPDSAATHVKFDYREDDIWICGDARSKIHPGKRAKMVVTFESNTECVTNWSFR